MATYGSEVTPHPPTQDMAQIDVLAGSVHDRTDSPAEFTGGDTESGFGGQAEGTAPNKQSVPGGSPGF